MFKSVKFEVIGDQRLNREKCGHRITRLLAPLRGVRQVPAQPLHQRIEVLIDTTGVEPAALAKHLGEAGYETRVAS